VQKVAISPYYSIISWAIAKLRYYHVLDLSKVSFLRAIGTVMVSPFQEAHYLDH